MDTLPRTGPPPTIAPERETYLRAATEILARIEGAQWAPTDLRAVLDGLAELALDTTGADRVSFFLLDEDGTSLNLLGASAAPNEALWEASVAMPSIEVDGVPGLREFLDGGTTLAIPEARSSPLIPSMWAELFEVGSLFLAPLRLGDESLGVLAVDYRDPYAAAEELVRVVGTLAGLSTLAISNTMLTGALTRQAARLETLLEATGALRSPRTLTELAGDLADLIAGVLDAPGVAIYLLEQGGEAYHVLAQRGVAMPEAGRVADLPKRAAAMVRASWRDRGPRPVTLLDLGRVAIGGPSLERGLVLPLRSAGEETFGFIVVGSSGSAEPSATTIRLAGALAAHVALAVERTQLDERVALAAEFACTLLSLDDLGAGGNEGLLRALREVVPPAIGFEVTGIRLLAAERPRRGSIEDDAVERRVWASWRNRRTRPPLHDEEGTIYAPIWADGRSIGLLRVRAVRSPLAPHERDLVEALATAIAERLSVHELRDNADRQARELAVVEERSRVATDLHATVGRLLATIARSAESVRDRLGTPADAEVARDVELLSHLAWAGRVGLQETAASLEAFTYHPGGLPATLDQIIDRLAVILDVAADLDVRGDVRPLPLDVEGALVRTMHEALARVESRGRATAVAVRLEYRAEEVCLEVRDDGVGLGAREDGGLMPGAHAGLRVIQQRLAELGGSLVIERPPPRGLLLRATVPA
jgi:signal transduction histidine kinase